MFDGKVNVLAKTNGGSPAGLEDWTPQRSISISVRWPLRT